jgi:hypothetical protein
MRKSALMIEGTELFSGERGDVSTPLASFVVLLPFENIAARLQEAHGIEGFIAIPYLEMDMRSRTAAGTA